MERKYDLKVYNTLKRKKEEFIPILDGKVNMYVCGPTVYNYISIGNARPIVVFNMVRNYLEYLGYEVNYVQNITDIEDKIISRANKEGLDYREITARYTGAFLEDINDLEIGAFSSMPRATDMIGDIIEITGKIMENGYAYQIDGNVYFDVGKFPRYGRLSGQKIDEMKATEESDFKKKNQVDFALWKKAKEGEPSWDSPWGKGRPGWHIECSAMSTGLLSHNIDIHGGGIDLVFPHHENEIAQSEAAFPDRGDFVRYWMHNGMIEVKAEKMSKSSGLKEDWILKNLLKKYSPNVIKLYMLSTHYRSPLEFSRDKLEEAKRSLEKITNTLKNIRFLMEEAKKPGGKRYCPAEKEITGNDAARASEVYAGSTGEAGGEMDAAGGKDGSAGAMILDEPLKKFEKNFKVSMDNDFNSAGAVASLFDFIREINSVIQSPDFNMDPVLLNGLYTAEKMIMKLSAVLGLNLERELQVPEPEKINEGGGGAISKNEIEKLIEERELARQGRDFKKADSIRDDLYSKGVILEDRKEGTIWKYRDQAE